MSVNPVTNDLNSSQFLKLMPSAAQEQQDPKVVPEKKPAVDPSSQSNNPNSVINDKISIETSPLKETPKNSSTKAPVGVVSHVVVSYNQQGEIRTKFVDSRNNVVYQIPSEMVAKIEDLMMKPNTSTDIKG